MRRKKRTLENEAHVHSHAFILGAQVQCKLEYELIFMDLCFTFWQLIFIVNFCA